MKNVLRNRAAPVDVDPSWTGTCGSGSRIGYVFQVKGEIEMPCYDPRNEPGYVLAEGKREWVHNSPVAQMLCEAMHLLEKHSPGVPVSDDLAQWWIAHQARDAEREKNDT